MYRVEIIRLHDDEVERFVPDIATFPEAQRRKESIEFRLDHSRYYVLIRYGERVTNNLQGDRNVRGN